MLKRDDRPVKSAPAQKCLPSEHRMMARVPCSSSHGKASASEPMSTASKKLSGGRQISAVPTKELAVAGSLTKSLVATPITPQGNNPHAHRPRDPPPTETPPPPEPPLSPKTPRPPRPAPA